VTGKVERWTVDNGEVRVIGLRIAPRSLARDPSCFCIHSTAAQIACGYCLACADFAFSHSRALRDAVPPVCPCTPDPQSCLHITILRLRTSSILPAIPSGPNPQLPVECWAVLNGYLDIQLTCQLLATPSHRARRGNRQLTSVCSRLVQHSETALFTSDRLGLANFVLGTAV
jgi:hypothetical protein